MVTGGSALVAVRWRASSSGDTGALARNVCRTRAIRRFSRFPAAAVNSGATHSRNTQTPITVYNMQQHGLAEKM